MRLLRLWPDESHFDFMRFRRFTFPLSALLSLATVALFLTIGLNFGIDFKGGTLVELQAKSGHRRRGGDPPYGRRLRLRRAGGAGTRQPGHRAGAPAAPARRAGPDRGDEQGARRLRQGLRLPPHGDRRPARLRRTRPVRHARRRALGRRRAALPVVPVRAGAGARRHRRHAPRHRADGGRVHHHPDRVQHDLDRRDPHHRRLLAQRDRSGVRPDPRADAPLQDHPDRRPAQPVDQLDHVAHGDDLDLLRPCRCWRWCCSAARRSRASPW